MPQVKTTLKVRVVEVYCFKYTICGLREITTIPASLHQLKIRYKTEQLQLLQELHLALLGTFSMLRDPKLIGSEVYTH